MLIDIISCSTIKIIISDDELADFDLCYKKIDENDINTQMLLLYMIEEIREQKNIDISSEKIYIEIFPIKSTGCLFYITIVNKTTYSKEKLCCPEIYTYKTEHIESILLLCKNLSDDDNVLESRLFYDEQYFYLIIEFAFSADIDNAVNEDDTVIYGEVYSSKIEEHCNIICNHNAISRLLEL